MSISVCVWRCCLHTAHPPDAASTVLCSHICLPHSPPSPPSIPIIDTVFGGAHSHTAQLLAAIAFALKCVVCFSNKLVMLFLSIYLHLTLVHRRGVLPHLSSSLSFSRHICSMCLCRLLWDHPTDTSAATGGPPHGCKHQPACNRCLHHTRAYCALGHPAAAHPAPRGEHPASHWNGVFAGKCHRCTCARSQ